MSSLYTSVICLIFGMSSINTFSLEVSDEILSNAKLHAPNFADILIEAQESPETLAYKLAHSELSEMLVDFPYAQEENKQQDQDVLPIVVTHGMGDSCFNPGMKNITSSAGAHLGNTYTHIHQLLISFP